MNSIGNDFTKILHMNLIPGIKLHRGYWQVNISYVSNENGNTTYNNGTFNCGGESSDFDVLVGQDVRDITFTCYRHNSFPAYPNTYINYSLRVDRILFLNLIYKLLNKTIKL